MESLCAGGIIPPFEKTRSTVCKHSYTDHLVVFFQCGPDCTPSSNWGGVLSCQHHSWWLSLHPLQMVSLSASCVSLSIIMICFRKQHQCRTGEGFSHEEKQHNILNDNNINSSCGCDWLTPLSSLSRKPPAFLISNPNKPTTWPYILNHTPCYTRGEWQTWKWKFDWSDVSEIVSVLNLSQWETSCFDLLWERTEFGACWSIGADKERIKKAYFDASFQAAL